MATTRWLSIHALSDSENSRLPLPPTLSPERSAAFIIASKSEFFSMTRRQVVALPRRADQNCMKPCGGTTPPEASSTLSHFATSLSKSRIPSFSTAARCCLSLLFFLFMESQMFLFVIPLLCLLHPPLGLCQTAASLNQLARTCMRRAAEGVSPTRLCTLSRLTTVFRGLHGRVDSAAPLVLSNGPASGFFMKTPFNNV